MPLEIERKFLVKKELFDKAGLKSRRHVQGYFNAASATVRVRISGDSKAFLSVKGAGGGISRYEFEYEIPVSDAREMMGLFCGSRIVEKTRYEAPHGGRVWEVDEFLGKNSGLLVAELELSSEDEDFPPPPWAGPEVSGDPRYYNSSLAENPFENWTREDRQ